LSQHPVGQNLAERARRFVEALAAPLGRAPDLHLAADYDALVARLLEGAVDVAWLPPLAQIAASTSGAELLVVVERAGSLCYRAALVVRRDAPYGAPRTLVQARAAWVDPRSASGYVVPRNHLAALGLDPARDFSSEKFYGHSDLACAAVASGEADLCAVHVSESALDREHADEELAEQLGEAAAKLRVLDVTDSIPPDGLVVPPAMRKPERAQIREALLGLHRSPEGAAALAELLQATRLAPVGADVERSIAMLRSGGRLGRH
jgi:phosphonate transport system substrate-binding protein